MKTLISILFMMLVGCATTPTKESVTGEEVKIFRCLTEKELNTVTNNNGTTAKPVKELTPEENKAVGEYELVDADGNTTKLVLLENGKVEIYFNDEKIDEATWKIVGKEVHVGSEKERAVFKVEPNGDLTCIASIRGGKRTELPNEAQGTWKKVK